MVSALGVPVNQVENLISIFTYDIIDYSLILSQLHIRY
jgi:hypothetical protein